MQPEVITNIAVGAVLALLTSILAWQSKGRSDALTKAVTETRSGLKKDLADTRSELKAETAQIRTELVSIHATITQVALAVRPQPRPEAG